MLVEFDRQFLDESHRLIGGIDEAGRGPLAGPVVCAMAIMPLDDKIDGVNDSKKLTPKKRDVLYNEIISKAISYSVAIIDERTIDRINILNATKQGMNDCIKNSPIRPDLILVDAVNGLNADVEIFPIIKGDAKSYNIACASIIAKVTRDRLMMELASIYPEYGFDKHKGYGTAYHIESLKKYGPCKIHRATFIKNFINQEEMTNFLKKF